jgi:hypothetical protein
MATGLLCVLSAWVIEVQILRMLASGEGFLSLCTKRLKVLLPKKWPLATQFDQLPRIPYLSICFGLRWVHLLHWS